MTCWQTQYPYRGWCGNYEQISNSLRKCLSSDHQSVQPLATVSQCHYSVMLQVIHCTGHLAMIHNFWTMMPFAYLKPGYTVWNIFNISFTNIPNHWHRTMLAHSSRQSISPLWNLPHWALLWAYWYNSNWTIPPTVDVTAFMWPKTFWS